MELVLVKILHCMLVMSSLIVRFDRRGWEMHRFRIATLSSSCRFLEGINSKVDREAHLWDLKSGREHLLERAFTL